LDHLEVRLERVELLVLDRLGEAIERLVDLGPARQALHVGEPALNVRIGREVAADDFAQRQQARPEVIRDGDPVAAQVGLVRAQPVVVQDLQPTLGPLLAPDDRRLVRLVGRPPMMREQLRVNPAVTILAIEVRVEPSITSWTLARCFKSLE
jgi:hypothetical protein